MGVSGLGGWLVLVQIGLYATIVLGIVQMVSYSIPAISPDQWEILTSKDSELYHPLWGAFILFELVYNMALIGYCAFTLVQFYRKKSIVPKLMMIFYSGSLVITVVDYGLAQIITSSYDVQAEGSMKNLVRSALTCAIWIPYFIKSERVKNTFIG